MKYVGRILILGFFSFGLACTKATPEFEQLDPNSIPQPKFSGATTKTVTVGSSASPVGTINGECDPKIKSIEAMIVGVATGFSGDLTPVASSSTVSCSSVGTFTLQIKSLSDLGFSPLVLGNTYEIQLKGMTSAGLSRASSIYIQYMSSLGNPNIRVTGGGIHGGAIRATDGTYQAEIQVQNVTKSTAGASSISTDSSGYSFRPAGFAR